MPQDINLHTNVIGVLMWVFKHWLPQPGNHRKETTTRRNTCGFSYMWMQDKKVKNNDPFRASVALVKDENNTFKADVKATPVSVQ